MKRVRSQESGAWSPVFRKATTFPLCILGVSDRLRLLIPDSFTMELVIQPTPEAASLIAAHIVANLVREKPACVLGLATGSTPLLMYRELARMHREDGLDFARVTTRSTSTNMSASHRSIRRVTTRSWRKMSSAISTSRARRPISRNGDARGHARGMFALRGRGDRRGGRH